MDFSVEHDWRGAPARGDERTRISLSRAQNAPLADLYIDIDAPFYDDPAPASPPGATPGLWEFEVVELFLLGAESRYLELEFGPHGHWLALELEGPRNVVRSETSADAVQFRSAVQAGRWRGRAQIDGALLPAGLARANAYAIHGCAEQRRYLAYSPRPGPAPDFHQLESFAPFDFDALPVRRSP